MSEISTFQITCHLTRKAHDFLAYARQPRTAQTSVHHPDAGTGPCPFTLVCVNSHTQAVHKLPNYYGGGWLEGSFQLLTTEISDCQRGIDNKY